MKAKKTGKFRKLSIMKLSGSEYQINNYDRQGVFLSSRMLKWEEVEKLDAQVFKTIALSPSNIYFENW